MMERFWEIAFQSFVVGIPKAFMGYLWGAFGFLLIGALFIAYQFYRNKKVISIRSVMCQVFPLQQYRGASSRIDIIIGVWNMFLTYSFTNFIIALGAIALGVSFLDLLNATFGERPQIIHVTWLIIASQFVAYMLANDLSTYVVHRAFHRVPALWAIHRAHHSAERLNYFTAYRDHPVEIIANYTIRAFVSAIGIGLFAFFTGTKIVPETTAFIAFFLRPFWTFYSTLGHSHIPISFWGPGNILLGGPVMHQIHHSAEKHMWDKNYSRVTHIWDWVFGTLYLPKKGETFRFGLNDYELGENSPHQTVRDFLIKPLAEFWIILKGERIPYPTDHPRGSKTGKVDGASHPAPAE